MPVRRPGREELAAAIIAPIILAVAAFAWIQGNAAAGESAASKLEAQMPVDSVLVAGALTNHLRYFVRPNPWPNNRIELRLAVNAGSVLESPTQHGLAHAVEHMVFRGTKHFPGHAVEDYLTSIGMRPGNDVNAMTGPDETIYRITIPANRAGIVDTALHILADMAGEATFDPAEARQEAGVIMEEWRMRSDAEHRLSDARNRLLFAGSPYADHTSIGDTTTLRRFDLGEMRRFYTDWYRPDLMAIVVVGDVDPNETISLIRRAFGPLRPRGATTPRPPIPVPISNNARAAILRESETTTSRLSFWHADSAIVARRIGDYRRTLVREVWEDIIRDRLDEISEHPGSPILDSYAGYRSLTRAMDAEFVGVQPAPGREAVALDTLAAAVARLAVYPVGVDELHQHTSAILRARKADDEWADNSSDLADDLIEEFLTGNTALTRSLRYELARDVLPTISAASVQAFAAANAGSRGALLTSIRRDRADTTGAADRLLTRARAALERPTRPIAQSSARLALMTDLPQPGKVVSETKLTAPRIFDWRLSNGMRVILKPTRFTSDDIQFHLLAPGGASLASNDDYPSAFFSDQVLMTTGIGGISGRDLARRLDETSIDLTATVSDDALSFSGGTAPRDLEHLFQVLHLYLTAPRSDTASFRRYMERRATSSEGRTADPDALFSDSVAAISTQHDPRALHYDVRSARRIDLGKALAFWRARTANGANFTFVMVGDFSLARARTLAERYLASVPAGSVERPAAMGKPFPAEIVRRDIVGGVGPRSRTRIVLSGEYDGTPEASDQLSIATDLAEAALGDRLRERMGGTYDVTVDNSVELEPPARYFVTIEFEANPERMTELTSAAMAELQRLRDSGPTRSEYAKLRATRMHDLEGDDVRNDYWAAELSMHARMGWPLAAITNHKLEASMLSPLTLQNAAARYLKTSAYVQVTMRPRVAKPR